MCLMILMASIKNLVGSYRPFFFEVCRPNLGLNCSLGSFIDKHFECTNYETSKYMLFDSRRSFPSGHVVVSVYSCLFFMYYLQTKLSKLPFLISVIHLLVSLWLVVCGISRITDNWHHVSDVIGGFLLTLPFVFYAVSKIIINQLMKLI